MSNVLESDGAMVMNLESFGAIMMGPWMGPGPEEILLRISFWEV